MSRRLGRTSTAKFVDRVTENLNIMYAQRSEVHQYWFLSSVLNALCRGKARPFNACRVLNSRVRWPGDGPHGPAHEGRRFVPPKAFTPLRLPRRV